MARDKVVIVTMNARKFKKSKKNKRNAEKKLSSKVLKKHGDRQKKHKEMTAQCSLVAFI